MADETSPDQTAAPDLPMDLPPIEKIEDEARKSFSLSDRLKGITQARSKVLLFLDADAVTAFAELANEEAQLKMQLSFVEASEPDSEEAEQQKADLITELEDQIESGRPALEAARTNMLEDALSVHLKAYPTVAVDQARRAARNKFADKVTKKIEEDQADDAQVFMDHMLLGRAIEKIVDSAGDEMVFARETVAEELKEALPATQWIRLRSAWENLTLTDNIGKAATDDPGF